MAAESDYYDDVSSLERQAVFAILQLWKTVDPSAISPSWAEQLPEALGILVAAQTVGAELADPYLTEVLVDADLDYPTVDPGALIGPGLDALLYRPAVEAKTLISQGAAVNQALLKASGVLSTYVTTGVGDTSRLAVTSGMTGRRHASGYYRFLRAPSCARCAIMAGRFYKWNRGFKRHPRCFPAGVTVSGPQTLAATRRWFEGELVILATASGQELTLTGNHPVLTSRGWVPANLLKEGDEVVRSTRPKGATPLVVPDHQQMPSPIEDVWSALRVSGLSRMPTSAEDFHGDGGHGEVDVVATNGFLGHERDFSLAHERGEQALTFGSHATDPLDRLRVPLLGLLGVDRASGGDMGGLGLRSAFALGHSGCAHQPGFAASSDRYSCGHEAGTDYVPAHFVEPSQGELAFPCEVSAADLLDRQGQGPSRWDSSGGTSTGQDAIADARVGRDLLFRLSGQVELDRVVESRRISWSGHVFNLNSSEGWFAANGLIVSNCDCGHRPVRNASDTSAYDTRKAIERGEVTGLSKANTKAILEYGANPSQVVNAQSGMYDIGQFTATTTGTTRRGIAGARILERDVARALGEDVSKRTFTNLTFDRYKAAEYAELFRRGKNFARTTSGGRSQQYAYRYTRTPRPTPQQIVTSASSRDEAIRMLTNYGYLI